MKYTFQLSFLFIVLSCQTAIAKKGYEHGYIIAKNRDTIYGEIKDRKPEPFAELYDKIRFVETGKRRVKKFNANDILGYGYNNVHFQSLQLREISSFFKLRYVSDKGAPYVFLKVIESSRNLIYYEMEFMYDDNCVIDAFPLFHKPQSDNFVRVTQGVFGLKKKQLSGFFADCNALVKAIETLKLRDAKSVFEFYVNDCGK